MKKEIYVAMRVNLIDADVSLIRAFGNRADAEAWVKEDAEEMLDDLLSSYGEEGRAEYVEDDVFLMENGYGTGTVLRDRYGEDDADVYLWQVLPADILIETEVG